MKALNSNIYLYTKLFTKNKFFISAHTFIVILLRKNVTH